MHMPMPTRHASEDFGAETERDPIHHPRHAPASHAHAHAHPSCKRRFWGGDRERPDPPPEACPCIPCTCPCPPVMQAKILGRRPRETRSTTRGMPLHPMHMPMPTRHASEDFGAETERDPIH